MGKKAENRNYLNYQNNDIQSTLGDNNGSVLLGDLKKAFFAYHPESVVYTPKNGDK